MPELILQGESLAFKKVLSQEGLPYSRASSLSEAFGNGARIFLLRAPRIIGIHRQPNDIKNAAMEAAYDT